jgi:hypothetical protein
MGHHIQAYRHTARTAPGQVDAVAAPLTTSQVTQAMDAEQGRTVGVPAEDAHLAARDAFMDHVMRCYQCSHVGVNCVEADGLEARMNTTRKADHAEPAGQS